jgi:FKBP-type peptidyl-prolyl cis-trans isomerase 2
MPTTETTTLRLGDCLNFPSKGEIVGVHYDLRDQFDQPIENTRERGKILEWRVGSASVLEQVDLGVRKISLGGK